MLLIATLPLGTPTTLLHSWNAPPGQDSSCLEHETTIFGRLIWQDYFDS
jgi:hypothetical protein